MKLKCKIKKIILAVLVVLNLITLPVLSQTSEDSTNNLDLSDDTTLPPLEDVSGFGKVICDLRVAPELVDSFKQLLSGGITKPDGSVIFRLKPPQDTITLNDKKDDAGNVIPDQKIIAFRSRDFVQTDALTRLYSQSTSNFFVDSVASYGITRGNLVKALAGTLASGDVDFRFLAWKGTADNAQSYKVTNATDSSFAVARITNVQPLTYTNTNGEKVKTAALSGRIKVSTDVNFLARKRFRVSSLNQTSPVISGKIVLDCKLIRCVLDRVKNIELINKAIENCSNVLFSGGVISSTQTEDGASTVKCDCGSGTTLALDSDGKATCCDNSKVITDGSGNATCPPDPVPTPEDNSTPSATPETTSLTTPTPTP